MPKDLKGEMRKLREKAYQKSMKKKGVRKFGEDEYFIPVKLPGLKKGGKVKKGYHKMPGGKIMKGAKHRGK